MEREFLQDVGGKTNFGERTGFEFAEEVEGILGNVIDNMTKTAIKASASEPEQGRHGLGLLDLEGSICPLSSESLILWICQPPS